MLSATFLYWIKINSYTNWVFLFISCIFMYLEMKTKKRRRKNMLKRKNIWHPWRLFPSQQNTLQVDVMTAALNQNSVIAAIVFQSQTAVTVYQWQTAVTMSVETSYELRATRQSFPFVFLVWLWRHRRIHLQGRLCRNCCSVATSCQQCGNSSGKVFPFISQYVRKDSRAR